MRRSFPALAGAALLIAALTAAPALARSQGGRFPAGYVAGLKYALQKGGAAHVVCGGTPTFIACAYGQFGRDWEASYERSGPCNTHVVVYRAANGKVGSVFLKRTLTHQFC